MIRGMDFALASLALAGACSSIQLIEFRCSCDIGNWRLRTGQNVLFSVLKRHTLSCCFVLSSAKNSTMHIVWYS
jgi:hypothetical protein